VTTISASYIPLVIFLCSGETNARAGSIMSELNIYFLFAFAVLRLIVFLSSYEGNLLEVVVE
jgi:hypothetical protein